MLERAALHQTRFRTPGVSPDARGVVLGQKGVVLFPSLDRLVAFLRAYGEEGSLDELLPGMTLRRVVTPLKTREIVLLCAAESSYRMDRVASVAKLAGGLVFTGTARHFVKYRDAASPLGYDVEELLDERADVVLYHDSFRQAYAFEREIGFRELVMKLEPVRVPPSERRMPARLFVTAEVGIGGALVGYLFRWRVRARAAFAEWPSESAFDDTTRRLYLFDVDDAPPRIVALMMALPGVNVFEPIGASFAVELGFRHPIALESCRSIFDDEALTLFRGDGRVVLVDPAPPFAPVRSLVRTPLSLDTADAVAPAKPSGAELAFQLPLKLDSLHGAVAQRGGHDDPGGRATVVGADALRAAAAHALHPEDGDRGRPRVPPRSGRDRGCAARPLLLRGRRAHLRAGRHDAGARGRASGAERFSSPTARVGTSSSSPTMRRRGWCRATRSGPSPVRCCAMSRAWSSTPTRPISSTRRCR